MQNLSYIDIRAIGRVKSIDTYKDGKTSLRLKVWSRNKEELTYEVISYQPIECKPESWIRISGEVTPQGQIIISKEWGEVLVLEIPQAHESDQQVFGQQHLSVNTPIPSNVSEQTNVEQTDKEQIDGETLEEEAPSIPKSSFIKSNPLNRMPMLKPGMLGMGRKPPLSTRPQVAPIKTTNVVSNPDNLPPPPAGLVSPATKPIIPTVKKPSVVQEPLVQPTARTPVASLPRPLGLNRMGKPFTPGNRRSGATMQSSTFEQSHDMDDMNTNDYKEENHRTSNSNHDKNQNNDTNQPPNRPDKLDQKIPW